MNYLKNSWLIRGVAVVCFSAITAYFVSSDWLVRLVLWSGLVSLAAITYLAIRALKGFRSESPEGTTNNPTGENLIKTTENEHDNEAEDPRDGDIKNPVSREWAYWLVIVIWITALVLPFFWLFKNGLFDSSTLLNIPVSTLLFYSGLLLWIGASIKVISLDEVAGVTFFGLPIKNIGPGPKLIPWLLFEVHVFSRKVEQRQFPADPEFVFKGEDKEPLPSGMQRPLRIITGEPASDSNSPFNIQMAVEFLYFLRIQINNPIVFMIQFGTIEEFWRQMRDTGDRIITNRVSATPGVAHLVKNFKALMDELDHRFKEVADVGGVRVIESGLSSPDVTHALSVAARDVGVNIAQATNIRNLGEAEKDRLVSEGEGKAAAEAALIRAVKAELANADPATIAAYLGQRVLGDKTVVLGAEGITQAFGLGKMIMKGDEK